MKGTQIATLATSIPANRGILDVNLGFAEKDLQEEYRRGRQIITAEEAVVRAHVLRPLDDPGIRWGGLVLPSEIATKHFCVTGSSGGGKTMIFRLLMQSVLPKIGKTSAPNTSADSATIKQYASRMESAVRALQSAEQQLGSLQALFGADIDLLNEYNEAKKISKAIADGKSREAPLAESGSHGFFKSKKSEEYGLKELEAALEKVKKNINPFHPRSAQEHQPKISELEKSIGEIRQKIDREYEEGKYQAERVGREVGCRIAVEYGYESPTALMAHLHKVEQGLVDTFLKGGGLRRIQEGCVRHSISLNLSSHALTWLNRNIEEYQAGYPRSSSYLAGAILSCFPTREISEEIARRTKRVEECRRTVEDIRDKRIDRHIAEKKAPQKPVLQTHKDQRAFIYDAKGDMLSILEGMKKIGLGCDIVPLDPFDKRSYAWDIAADINDFAAAERLAAILIPEDKNPSQPYFANAARDLLKEAVIVLMTIRPKKWTLRDLLLALNSKARLVELLNMTPETQESVELYFSDERTAGNVLSEIRSRTARYRIVAALWHRAKKKVSLAHWLRNDYILVLGRNKKYAASLDPINRAMFERVTDLICSPEHTNSKTRRTWFFLDEVRNAGNLESLSLLLTEGRSKGVCVVLGFQAITGMYEAFGENVTKEVLGQCGNKIALQVNDEETAKWASGLFGKYEFLESETGENQTLSRTNTETKTASESQGKTLTKGSTTGNTDGYSSGKSIGKSSTSSEGTSQNLSDGSSSGLSLGNSTTSSPSVIPSFGISKQVSQQFSRQQGVGQSQQRTDGSSFNTTMSTSRQTSNQASESTADQRGTQTSTALSQGDGMSLTRSINRKRMQKDSVMYEQFMTLPETNPANGLNGYYLIPSVGAFYGEISGQEIDQGLTPLDAYYPLHIPRADKHQRLTLWKDKEIRKLGLPVKTDSGSEKSNEKPSSKGDNPPLPSGEETPGRKLRASRGWLPNSDSEQGIERMN